MLKLLSFYICFSCYLLISIHDKQIKVLLRNMVFIIMVNSGYFFVVRVYVLRSQINHYIKILPIYNRKSTNKYNK